MYQIDSKDFRMTQNVWIRPEWIGLENLLNSFVTFDSTQRGSMWAAHTSQWELIDGCEPPQIGSGFEYLIGQYEVDPSERDVDGQILAVVPKYRVRVDGIRSNPSQTVIYVGDDHVVDCFEVPRYTVLSNGSGYENVMLPTRCNLVENQFIPKDMKFTASPAQEGNFYKMGTNGNVLYLPDMAVTEDAIKIRKSFADKLRRTGIKTFEYDIPLDKFPLNLYGTDVDYKMFPDIGETINEDGVLCAFRTVNDMSFVVDMKTEALNELRPFDDPYYGEAGGQVIDVDVVMNPNSRVFRENRNSRDTFFAQLVRYQRQHAAYCDRIIEVYKSLKTRGYKLSPAFNTLVTKCMEYNEYYRGRRITFTSNKEDIPVAHITIRYMYKIDVSLGNKMTGRHGNKGVISEIIDDEYAYRTEDGVIADVVVCTKSCPNRNNPGQWYEQLYNYISDEVAKAALALSDDEGYSLIMTYLNDVNPEYAAIVQETVARDFDGIDQLMDAVRDRGIILVLPPASKHISPDRMRYLCKKYNIQEKRICYKDKYTGKIKWLKKPSIISSIYWYLLYKQPSDLLASMEFHHTSQFNIPMKPTTKHANDRYPLRQTPIRFIGEDETGLHIMSNGGRETARLLALYAGSPAAVRQMQYQLMTAKKPTAIRRIDISTEEAVLSNANVQIFKHAFGCIGYDVGLLTQRKTKRKRAGRT